jgi:hypothetical protein
MLFVYQSALKIYRSIYAGKIYIVLRYGSSDLQWSLEISYQINKYHCCVLPKINIQ